MSFMRPTINTAEELNKWTVNSMMGVFQRTTTGQSPTDQQAQTPTTRSAAVPLNFGSTITQQESPPSSPRVTAATTLDAIEENEVMFDGDHIFDEETTTKSEDILKDIDQEKSATEEEKKENTQEQQEPTSPSHGERIDSSFFDDDDEEEED
jgi:hypothetical protein